MKIVIRADRKIRDALIAEYKLKDQRLIDRFVNLISDLEAEIFIASDSKIHVANTKSITISAMGNMKEAIVLDLKNIYDDRKLKKLIKKKKDTKKAIIKENKEIADLRSFGCMFHRKEWNPINRYYIEPLGEKIGFMLRNTSISANQVTFLNVILGILASYLIYRNTILSLIIFAIWVRFFHLLDIVDGHIARLQNKGSPFGQWIDGGGDKFVITLWYIFISYAVYQKTGKIFFLIVGLVAMFGIYMYNYLMLTSVMYFRNAKSSYKSETAVKKNPIVSFILLFIDYDVHLHILTLCALTNRLEWFLTFYALYFNFMWGAYFLYYLKRHLTRADAKEI